MLVYMYVLAVLTDSCNIVSAQDGIENNPDQDMTDEEESSDEEPI